MPRFTNAQRIKALAKFWGNRDFRKKVLDTAKAEGVIPKAINPDNFKLILDFIKEILPIILRLFVKV